MIANAIKGITCRRLGSDASEGKAAHDPTYADLANGKHLGLSLARRARGFQEAAVSDCRPSELAAGWVRSKIVGSLETAARRTSSTISPFAGCVS